MPSTLSLELKNDVEKKVWQPVEFGDKGLSEALKRLKVEGSRPDCRCLRRCGCHSRDVSTAAPRRNWGSLPLVFLTVPFWTSAAILRPLRPLRPHPPPPTQGTYRSTGSSVCTPLTPSPACWLACHLPTDLRLAHPCPHPHLSHSPLIWMIEVTRHQAPPRHAQYLL